MPGEMIPVAGGKQGEQKISVQQPQFSATGELFYISDDMVTEPVPGAVRKERMSREAEFGGLTGCLGWTTTSFSIQENHLLLQ